MHLIRLMFLMWPKISSDKKLCGLTYWVTDYIVSNEKVISE
jgi:hypothetical protein